MAFLVSAVELMPSGGDIIGSTAKRDDKFVGRVHHEVGTIACLDGDEVRDVPVDLLARELERNVRKPVRSGSVDERILMGSAATVDVSDALCAVRNACDRLDELIAVRVKGGACQKGLASRSGLSVVDVDVAADGKMVS